MQTHFRTTRLLFVLIAVISLAFTSVMPPASGVTFAVVASSNPPPGPDRFTVISVEYTAYEWHLRGWRDQHTACTIFSEHDQIPLPWEVYRDCGKAIHQKWMAQPPCNIHETGTCTGYYAVLVGDQQRQKEIAMKLPAASAWISLEDCQPVFSAGTNACENNPTIVFKGLEPLPNESIFRIEGTYDGLSFFCDMTDICKFELPETGDDGVKIQFWSHSTYGDTSPVYNAQVRVKQVDEGDPDRLYWYVDVLSSQWQGQAATCSEAWDVFPPVGGVPEWLGTPKQSEELSSDIPYTYLAANLILQGVVDASACPDGGVSPGGVANQCGLRMARTSVHEWQNQFDDLILGVARETGVPARLLKNLFARESQFWPGVYQGANDVGLGQLTENGADTTLFWNRSFFNQFCPLVMDANACGAGYASLEPELQAELRRALVKSVNAACEDCPLGLDLTQSHFSISVFAHTMTANCEQAGQVIYNYTNNPPSQAASYEDLWKFTLVNYNAGGGCLAEAVSLANGISGLPLTWESVSPHLLGICSNAVGYVNDISR